MNLKSCKVVAIAVELVISFAVACLTFERFNAIYHPEMPTAYQLEHAFHNYGSKNSTLGSLEKLLKKEPLFIELNGQSHFRTKGSIYTENLAQLKRLMDSLGCEYIKVLVNTPKKLKVCLVPYYKRLVFISMRLNNNGIEVEFDSNTDNPRRKVKLIQTWNDI
jgi:hypothetical protein